MRFANVNGRACVAQGEHFFDIAQASGGRFSCDVQSAYSRWGELTAWFATDFSADGRSPALGPLGAPVPAPVLPGTINAMGGVPIKVGNQLIGAVSVSGAPGGDKDAACANAALAKVADKLK